MPLPLPWPFAYHMALGHTPYVFELLDTLGYDGWFDCQHRPAGKTDDGQGCFRSWATVQTGNRVSNYRTIGSGRNFYSLYKMNFKKKATAFKFFDTRTVTSRNGPLHMSTECALTGPAA